MYCSVKGYENGEGILLIPNLYLLFVLFILSRIIIDPRYFIVVGGDTYLIDYLRQPTWDLENKIPIFNEIYKRVNPSDKSINNPYIIRKQLEMGSKEDLFHFYHPYIPFDVENSKASSWLSWCNVQIPGESGVLGKEETVQLLRVRSGTDMKDFSRKSMNDMLVIDALFPSDSVMNWNNWLKHAETLPQEVSSSKVVKDEVTSVISSLSSALISSQQVLSHLNSLVGFMEFQGIEKNGRVIQNINMGNRQKKISKGDGQEVSTYDVKNYDISENAFTQAGNYFYQVKELFCSLLQICFLPPS